MKFNKIYDEYFFENGKYQKIKGFYMKKNTFITCFILLFIFIGQATWAEEPKVLYTNIESRIPFICNNIITWVDVNDYTTYIYKYDITDEVIEELDSYPTVLNSENDKNLAYPPHTDGTFIVWSALKDGDWDIFLWRKGTDPSSKINISDPSDNNRNDFAPYVSNGKVVWFQGRINQSNSYHEIWIWDNNTATRFHSGNTVNDCRPKIYSDSDNTNIVWQKARGASDPIGYTIMVNSEPISKTASGNHINPIIDNRYIFWQNGENIKQIIIDYISSGDPIPTISKANTTKNSFVQLSNNIAVWQGDDGTDFEIYMWKEGNGVIQITNNGTHDMYPHVYYDQTKSVHSLRVVWQGFDGHDTEIYLYANDRITQLTNNSVNDCRPQVWGDSVVWESYENGGFYQINLLKDAVGPYISIYSEPGFDEPEKNWDYYTQITGNIDYDSQDTGDRSWEYLRVLKALDGTILDKDDDWVEFSNPILFNARENEGGDEEKYEGRIDVYVRLKDNQDNYEKFSNVAKTQIRLDGTPPEIISIEGISDEGYITQLPQTLTVIAADQENLSKIKELFYWVCNGTNSIYDGECIASSGTNSVTCDITIDSDEATNIAIQVCDWAGNYCDETIPIQIDNTGPSDITITLYDEYENIIAPDNDQYWTNSYTVSATLAATDTQSGVDDQSWEYLFWDANSNDNTWESCSTTQVFTGNDIINENNYFAAFHVKDNAGNPSGDVVINFNIDRTKPELEVSEETDWSNNPAVLVATGTATDAFAGIKRWIYASGINLTNPARKWKQVPSAAINNNMVEITDSFNNSTSFFSEGENYVWFRVVDKAGNAVTARTIVRKDTVKPAITITTDGWSNGTVDATAFDSTSDINPGTWGWLLADREIAESEIPSLSWNSPSIDPATPGNATASVSSSGNQRIWFKISDNAGNYILANAVINFDFKPPTITLQTTDWTNGERIEVRFTDTGGSGIDPSQCSWSQDAEEYINCVVENNSATIDISPYVSGTQEIDIWFKAADNAGNTTVTQSLVKVDRTPPIIAVNLPDDVTSGEWTGVSPVEINVIVEDDNPASGPCSKKMWTSDTNTEPDPVNFTPLDTDTCTIEKTGITELIFMGIDGVGNEAFTGIYEIKIDTENPNPITFTFSGNVQPEEWTNGLPVEVTAHATDDHSGINPESWEYSILLPGNTVVHDSTNTFTLTNENLVNEGINQATFQVSDNVGNTIQETVNIKIDTLGPLVSAGVKDYTVIQGEDEWVIIDTLIIEDTQSGLQDHVTWSYAFDGTDNFIDFPETVTSNGSHARADNILLSTLNLDDGDQRLYLKAEDILGNEGFADYGFYIDRTRTSITNIHVQGLSSEDEYSQYANVMIEVSVDDEARLTGFQYSIESFFTENPVFDTEVPLDNGNEPFEISLENEGINYLYIRAVEQGGLIGNHAVKIIRLDTGQPGIPSIESLTHPRANNTQDAVPVKDAVFSVIPGSTSVSGIKGYRYELQKGAELYNEGFITGNLLEINNLDDNTEDEFYNLSVWAVGGNNRSSYSAATYRFRIDTEPPVNLAINAIPHSNPEYYYPNSTVLLMWNKPRDMTGVKNYHYKLTGDETELENPEGWTTTGKLKAEIDLETILELKYGRIFFAVRAEDYADNWQSDQGSLLFDVQKPGLEHLPGLDNCINVIPDLYARTAFVEWGIPYDEGSGFSRLEIQKTRIISQVPEPNPVWDVVEEGTYTFLFDGLDQDTIYRINIKVVDHAGNVTVYHDDFRLDGVPVTIDISEPFSMMINGCRVYGIWSTDPAKTEVFLEIPESLELKQIDTASGEEILLDQVEFTGFEFIQGDTFKEEDFLWGSTALPAESVYVFDVAGFPLQAGELIFTADNGLGFNSITYTASLDNNQTKTFEYAHAELSNPPFIFFKSCSITEGEEFHFQSDYRTGDGEIFPGWILSGITRTCFDDTYFQCENGRLNTQGIGAYIQSGEDNVYELPVSFVQVTPERTIGEGQIESAFFLHQGRNLFSIDRGNAFISNNKIIILEAEIIFNTDSINVPVIIKNFSIDVTGIIREEPGFHVSGFTFTDEYGNEYKVVLVHFEGNNLIIEQGYINNTIGFSGLVLTEDGPDYGMGAAIDPIRFQVHGYTVTCEQGILNADGIEMPEAWIVEFPAAYGGQDQKIDGLGIRIADFSVYQPGTGNIPFSFVPDYGKEIEIRELELNASGLYAVNTAVPMPDVLGGQTVMFSNLPLLSNGIIVTSMIKQEPVLFPAADYTCTGQSAVFDGAGISFKSVDVVLPEECYPQDVSFTGFRVNGTGIESPGTYTGQVSYSNYGWDFSLPEPSLDELGIKARAVLWLPYEFGNRELEFQDFRLFAAGGFDSGTAEQGFIIRIHGWKVEISGISVEQEVLVCGKGIICLYSTMGFGELIIDDSTNGRAIVLNSDGTVESCAEGSGLVEFLAENGFLVGARNYTFTDQGLMLKGKVYFPAGLEQSPKTVYADYNEYDIILDSDGVIITEPSQNRVTYSIAGWDVGAEDYWFDREGLTIEKNYLSVLGITICVPHIQYYADGNIKVAGQSFEGFDLPLFGGRVGVAEILFTDQGLNLKAFVTLPDVLGGFSMYFDNLTLHPDGSISTDAAIREYSFDLFGFGFLFRNIRLDQDGLTIGEGIVILPEELENKRIHMLHFRIKADGSFELGGLGFDPFYLWGFTFHISNIGLSGDAVSFEGSITLPDYLFEGLAGKRLTIDRFDVSLQGELLGFKVSLNQPFEFPLFEDWKIIAENIGVERSGEEDVFWILIERGTLVFPEWLDVADQVSISGMKINPITGEFYFDEIEISGVHIEEFGFDFYLDTLTISNEFDFAFAGNVTLPDYFPDAFSNKTIVVDIFEITHEGEIGRIEGSLKGINTDLWDTLYLTGLPGTGGAELYFLKEENNLSLGCSGVLDLKASVFPAGIGGNSLTIDDFKMSIDTEQNKVVIDSFHAVSDKLNFSLFGFTRIEDAVISIYKNPDITGGPAGSDIEVSVQGNIVLPEAMPEFLRNQKVTISSFTINLAGEIIDFEAGLTITGEYELFSGVLIRDPSVHAGLVEKSVVFNIGGTLVLSESFPEGLAGVTCEISSLQFDTNGTVIDLIASATIPDLLLFDTLKVNNGKIDFVKNGTKDAIISISGDIVLPDFFQESGTGRIISLTEFTINSSGEIISLDASASLGNIQLFDALTIKDIEISVTNRGNDEFLFSGSGAIELPGAIKSLFPDMPDLKIYELTFSSKHGLTAFRAGADFPVIRIELFKGITLVFNSLDVGAQGIQFSGDFTFSNIFPAGLRGESFALNNVEIGWDGTFLDIQAGIPYRKITLGGFEAEITNLMLGANGITLDSCIITLPPSMNSMKLGFKNAGFNTEGRFYGEIIVPAIEVEIAGFQVVLYDPGLDVNRKEISFSRAGLKMPDFIGGMELTLYGVKVTPSAIEFSGGSFRLPDFVIAGGLGFKNIYINFKLDGDKYEIDGGGTILIPGAGTFGVEVSFVNRSTTYPWGLKRAYFSYQVAGLGMPLGPTGLYLNGIRGGLAFGPPDEIPKEVRGMFDEGTRLQLGLSMTGPSGGSIVKADVDVWVDINNWGWAFEGNVSILSGFVKAWLIAALTNKGFYGEFGVDLKFVRGEVKVYVFPYKGRTQVSGEGWVQFGLREGCIVDEVIEIFFVEVHIVIPPWTIWLPKIGAAFGLFKNGDEGFKGYVDVPVFGEVGIFMPKSGWPEFGNVSKYQLYDPFARSAATNRNTRIVVQNQNKDQNKNQNRDQTGQESYAIPGRPGVIALDDIIKPGVKDTYSFNVPGVLQGGQEPDHLLKETTKKSNESQSRNGSPEEIVERLVFLVAYDEGDPLVTPISPGGKKYYEGDADLKVEYFDWGKAIIIFNPEPGNWTTEVSNVISQDAYFIEVYGKTQVPEITVETPAIEGLHTDTSFQVTGHASTNNGAPAHVAVYLTHDRDAFIGNPVAEATAQPDGAFSIDIDATGLADGTYYIYAGIEAGNNPEKHVWAPGSILIKHDALPVPVTGLIAAEREDGEIEITYADPNGERTKGFNLYIENLTTGKSDVTWLGYLLHITIPGFEPGHTVRISVAAVDDLNREGEHSEYVSLTMSDDKDKINEFAIIEDNLSLDLEISKVYEDTLTFETILPPVTTGTAYDYIDAVIGDSAPGLHIGFGENHWNVTQGAGIINYMIRPDESMSPGEYTVTINIENKGNREISDQVHITATVTYPGIMVNRITPVTWNTLDETVIEVFGEYFFPGTRLYLDDRELIVDQANENYIQTMIPSGMEGGLHDLRIVGPGEDEVIRIVNVVTPTYVVVGFKTRAPILCGGSGDFMFTIKGENRFTGSASFSIGQAPAGWETILSPYTISENELAIVSITVPSSAELGDYTVQVLSDQGDILPLTVTVTDIYPDAHISSLFPFSGFTGDPVMIFGYGFADQGIIHLGDTELPVISYNQDAVTARIPEGVSTGEITVTVDSRKSNGVLFYVKDRGFNIYPAKEQIELKPGEEQNVIVYVSGYEKIVELESVSNNDQLHALLNKQTIVPNDSTVVTISAAQDIPNGNYPVIITGRSGNSEMCKSINVVVGEAFRFVTEHLPRGMEDTGYSAELVTANGTGRSTYTIDHGDLPPGLSLSPGGTISGRPQKAGTRYFVVKAGDQEQRSITQTFAITIEENNWAQDNKDSGRTRYNPVITPADNRKLWTSKQLAGAQKILTGKKMIFVLCSDHVAGFDAGAGTLMFIYKGIFTEWAYASQNLYLLDQDGVFHAVDSFLGNVRWQRQGISHFTLDNNTLYLAETNTISVINPENGTLIDRIQAPLPAQDPCVWQNGNLLRSDGRSLYLLTADGWQTVFQDQGYTISDVSADKDEIALLLSAGRLVILGQDYEIKRAKETGITDGMICLGDERIVIGSLNETAGFRRSDLVSLYQQTSRCIEIASGLEKVFIIDEYSLKALNGYNGLPIWTVGTGHNDLAIAGEKIYALDENGFISCYNGPDNIYYPFTEIVAHPGVPDGENDYYVTKPIVEIKAQDPETYVAQIFYRYGEEPFIPYNDIIVIPEGQDSLVAYSTDSNGYRGPDIIKEFKVDTTAPVTQLSEQGSTGENGYYITGVEVSLVAADNLSGVDRIDYMINNADWTGYTGSLKFNNQGEYHLQWKARDKAGNTEEIHEKLYNIDLYDPVVSARSLTEPGLSIIYLAASDTYSGINRIEYSINGGEIQTYLDPFVIRDPGQHTIEYRAMDNAGRSSGWEIITIDVPVYETSDWICNLYFACWMPGRGVVRDIQVGDRIYAPSYGRWNRIRNLPPYLAGADYIRTNMWDKRSCGPRFLWFTAGADIDVFIMKHKYSKAGIEGWQLVEEDFPVEPWFFFKGGADIYTKNFKKGEEVIIPGSCSARWGWGNLVFVQYAQSNYVKIISPMPDSDLAPCDTVRYAAAILMDGDFSREWQVKFGEDDWQVLGNEASGELTLPYTADKLPMSLKLMIRDNANGNEIEKTRDYQIVNKTHIELIEPYPGTELLAGTETVLEYRAYDSRDCLIDKSAVQWYSSRDTQTWVERGSGQNTFTVPSQTGPYYLKAEFEDTPGYTSSFIFEYNIVETYSPFALVFGLEQDELPCCSGEEFSLHEDGRLYGFDRDHSDNCGIVWIKEGNNRPVKTGNIRLKWDAWFKYHVKNGKYRVKVYLGPIYKWERHGINIEDINIAVWNGWSKEIKVVTAIVDVTDGMLDMTGTYNLPLMKLEGEHLPPGDESPPGEYSVEDMEGVQVMHEERKNECGRRK